MFPVLFAQGLVGVQESALIVQATLLMLIVIVPVLGLLFFFAWRYRAGAGARYEPNWRHSALDELVWWAVPLEIILVLAAVTWQSTHRLDPHVPLAGNVPPLRVEVVALPWKWLFIYPEQHVATVNYLELPVDTPVVFSITADAPMNSFWIPALGGQIYAMTGMQAPLSLVAAHTGTYQGLSANYSGEHFADMHFVVRVVTRQSFGEWAAQSAAGTTTLATTTYAALAAPGTTTPATFAHADSALFDEILEKYASPGNSHH